VSKPRRCDRSQQRLIIQLHNLKHTRASIAKRLQIHRNTVSKVLKRGIVITAADRKAEARRKAAQEQEQRKERLLRLVQEGIEAQETDITIGERLGISARRVRYFRKKHNLVASHPGVKFSDDEIQLIRDYLAQGISSAQIAKRMGIARASVYRYKHNLIKGKGVNNEDNEAP
jgi:DNA-binding CsgD family transcriptional regulator